MVVVFAVVPVLVAVSVLVLVFVLVLVPVLVLAMCLSCFRLLLFSAAGALCVYYSNLCSMM